MDVLRVDRRKLFSSVLSLVLPACFAGELDPDISGVFVCEAAIDCAVGLECIEGICVDGPGGGGPELLIEAPVQLDVFAEGGSPTLPLRLSGEGLTLTADATGSGGYVEIQIDGALIDTVHEGDLAAGIDVTSLPMPIDPGLHHLTIIARHPDGSAFENEGAIDHIGFWIDDGEEHVGILSPPPAARVPLGEGAEMSIEVASLNFTFVNPGFTAPADGEEAIGYVNLYIDTAVPGCLPECNFDYQTSILPAGLSRVNRIISEQGVLLPDGFGAARLQIVAQTTTHQPYYRAAATDSIVYHQVPIQSVVEVTE